MNNELFSIGDNVESPEFRAKLNSLHQSIEDLAIDQTESSFIVSDITEVIGRTSFFRIILSASLHLNRWEYDVEAMSYDLSDGTMSPRLDGAGQNFVYKAHNLLEFSNPSVAGSIHSAGGLSSVPVGSETVNHLPVPNGTIIQGTLHYMADGAPHPHVVLFSANTALEVVC